MRITILMGVPDLLLRAEFMHSVLVGQHNCQGKRRAIDGAVEVSKRTYLVTERLY